MREIQLRPTLDIALRASVARSGAGGDTSVIARTLRMMGSTMSFERNGEIFAEEEPAEYLYLLVSGVVRTCKFLEDGRRQIGAFHFAGDLFGFEPSEAHGFSAEAVTGGVPARWNAWPAG